MAAPAAAVLATLRDLALKPARLQGHYSVRAGLAEVAPHIAALTMAGIGQDGRLIRLSISPAA